MFEFVPKYCLHCGQTVRRGANFCGACGKSIKTTARDMHPPIEASMVAAATNLGNVICCECGFEQPASLVNCTCCGHQLGLNPPESQTVFCLECGLMQWAGRNFCGCCGSQLQKIWLVSQEVL